MTPNLSTRVRKWWRVTTAHAAATALADTTANGFASNTTVYGNSNKIQSISIMADTQVTVTIESGRKERPNKTIAQKSIWTGDDNNKVFVFNQRGFLKAINATNVVIMSVCSKEELYDYITIPEDADTVYNSLKVGESFADTEDNLLIVRIV